MPTGRPRKEQWANGGSTTINDAGGISAGDTSVTVTSASSFPTEGDFRIKIDSEYMTVTAVSGNTFTIERGVDGSTAASHSDGATVTHYVTSGSILRAFHDAYNLPSTGNHPFNRVQRNDTNATLAAGDFTWHNQGTATCVAADDGGLKMTMPSEAAVQVRGKYLSTPATPWWLGAYVQFGPGMARWTGGGTGSRMGVFGRESSTGKLYTLFNRSDVIAMWRQTNDTTFSADVDSFIDDDQQGVWLRIGDDGADVFGEVSYDGSHWEVCFNEGRTSFMSGGINQVGFFAESGNAVASAEFYFRTVILEA